MSKFTKGTWIFYGEFFSEADTIFDDDMHPIAYVYLRDDSEANGRLIAAAPEMYELLSINANVIDTLIHEYELFDDADISWLNDHLDMAEKLLARIDGKENEA